MSYYIGVMSGTSLDGIDIALSDFSDSGEFGFIAAETFPIPTELHGKLLLLINNQETTLEELGAIDIVLGQLIGKLINQFLTQHQLGADDITAIGSHGQTIYHSPNSSYPFSQQIGNANVIAEMTGITTVADFRQRDIAAGGQGAPLVPAFHQALFRSLNEDRFIVNIGGISNLTLLPSSSKQAVIGFDTGPGNVLIDYWTQSQLKQPYDRGGQWAASGQCDNEYLSLLLNEPYFKQTIPKSTGRELFNAKWFEKVTHQYRHNINPADIQATLVELTTRTISDEIKTYATSKYQVFICGGGAHNDYLLTRLQDLLGERQVSTTEIIGLHPDWVEACAFSWLAYRTMTKQAGNLPSVTGAKHPTTLGAIYPA
ncbi:MAG: anhydro-N-acetylmuramic acid kinase [Gammaproteobacteria bacterium]|nr:anhydro-N-acetylmuramic acid kinase [Gammaproteobacteria bacterium]